MLNTTPGAGRAVRGLISSLAGIALLAVILWGVITEEAFPLLDSTGIPGSGCWVCPTGLFAGVGSLMGLVTGFIALGELKERGPTEARGKAWGAVIFGGLGLAALLALVIYFGNRGLMR